MKSKNSRTFRNLLGACLFCSICTILLDSCITTAGVTTYETYTPPAWAPPYDDASSIHYYYFPDYDMYYDVWGNQFWYSQNGAWVPSAALPPAYANVDLYSSYIVLVNKKYTTPWVHHDYFTRNYPPHSYDNYTNIVVKNRIVRNVQPNQELVPRAYNENNSRVIFQQRPQNVPGPADRNPYGQVGQPQPANRPNNNPADRNPYGQVGQPQPQNNRPQQAPPPSNTRPSAPPPVQTPPRGNNVQTNNRPQQAPPPAAPARADNNNRPQQVPPPQQNNAPAARPNYNNQSKEVPIKNIRPYMPATSQKLNYGGASNHQRPQR